MFQRKTARTLGLVGFAFVMSLMPAPTQLSAQSWSEPDSASQVDPEPSGGRGHVISVDLLRHPITEKTRRMLQEALRMMGAGKHQAAIAQLQKTLAKYPDSAAYADSLIGIEYLKTDQFTAAVKALEGAVALLPHDAINRYNLGLSLVCAGDYGRGEQEVRRALEMDPKNASMQALLTVLVEHRTSGRIGHD